jgi:hypothetical protein
MNNVHVLLGHLILELWRPYFADDCALLFSLRGDLIIISDYIASLTFAGFALKSIEVLGE